MLQNNGVAESHQQASGTSANTLFDSKILEIMNY